MLIGVLALVVDDAAPVEAPVLLGQCPGRQASLPVGVEPANDVAVAIAEHGRQVRVLDPLGIRETGPSLSPASACGSVKPSFSSAGADFT